MKPVSKLLSMLVPAAAVAVLWGCAPAAKKPAPVPPPAKPAQGLAAAEPAAAQVPAEKPGLLLARLDNGMDVVLVERHAAPLVTVQVWVRCGAMTEESLTGSGVSHFVEHMLFKGTAKRKVREMDQQIAAAGGYINAYTSDDRTVYHITLPTKGFALALDCLADAVGHATFPPEECEREREVILKEINLGDDEPDRIFSRYLNQTLYTVHPRRHQTIGYREIFEKVSREQLVGYYRRMYVPNNMVFVAAGDFDSAVVLEKVRAAFKDFARRPFEAPRVPEEPAQAAPREVTVRDGHFNDVRLCVSWPSVSIASPNMYPLDLGAAVLGGGRTSRLHRRLVEQDKLAFSVGAGNYTPETAGHFSIHAHLKEENLPKALAAIDEELARLIAGGVEPAEVQRVLARHRADEVYARETVDGLAQGAGSDYFLTGDAEFSKLYLERLAAVKSAEVSAVLRKYLVPERRNAVTILPAKVESAQPPKKAARAGAPKIERVELPGGARLLLVERHEDPIVAASAVFLGGLRFEPEGQNGVSDLMANMLKRGTARHSAEQLAEILESRGASLSCSGGRNSFGVSAKFLAGDLPTGLGLVAAVLSGPTFPPDEFEKLRTRALAGIRQRHEDIWDENDIFADSLLYAGHPYARQPSGTEESVKALKREDLVGFHQRFCRPDNMVLCLVGDFDAAAAKQAVLEQFKEFLVARPDKFAPPAVPAMPDLAGAGRFVQEKPGARQAVVKLAFRGVGLTNQDRFALSALQAVLNGMGNRLFFELRDKQSLAYSVGCHQDVGLDPGGFLFFIGTEPDKVEVALAGMWKEIDRIRSAPVSADELSAARNHIAGTQAMQQQRVEGVAQGLATNERFGLGAEAYFTYAQEIEKLTADDLLKAARKYFDKDRFVVAISQPPGAGPEPAK